ncbi:uncharacterized mitochondrial protein-like protein [Tanacetum coccineum]
MRPFRCPVTILNTIDHLGKFDGKADEGFFVGYSTIAKHSKVWRKKKDAEDPGNESGNPTEGKDSEVPSTEEPRINQEKDDNINSTNNINTASDGNNTNNVNVVSSTVNAAGIEVNAVDPKTSIELPNDPNMPELEDIVYSDDDEDVGAEADMNNLDAFMPVSPIPTTRIHKDHPVEQIIGDLNSTPQTRRMTKNLKEHEPKKVIQALKDPSWIEAMQDELLQFKLQKRGKIDKTLFIKRDKGDILLVQVYVDDIIFGFTKKSLCTEFEKMMHKKYQMSSMGELTFFLGLQVKQKEDGIFISQDKYVTEILKKFSFTDVKTASTPMETQKPFLKDEDGEEVDVHLYRLMIGSLMYLTASRPDIMFTMCACARYQVNPKVSHLHAVKRIFRYLKGKPKLGICYLKDSPFDLVAYTDSDYARESLDRKSTTGVAFLSKPAESEGFEQVVDFLNANPINYALTINPIIFTSCIEQFWASVKVKTVNGEVQLQALVDGKKVIITESIVRRDLQLEDAEGVDCLPSATIFEQLTLMGYEKLSQNLIFYKAFFSPQ